MGDQLEIICKVFGISVENDPKTAKHLIDLQLNILVAVIHSSDAVQYKNVDVNVFCKVHKTVSFCKR